MTDPPGTAVVDAPLPAAAEPHAGRRGQLMAFGQW